MAITYASRHNGYKINTDKNKKLGCDTKILDKLQGNLEYMTEKHVRTLQVRLDLRYPTDGSAKPQKGDFTQFIKNYKRNLERNYKLPEDGKVRGKSRIDKNSKPLTKRHSVDPMIALVTEKHREKGKKNDGQQAERRNPHAHVVVHVNGSIKKDADDVQQRAVREWQTVLGLTDRPDLVDFCDKNGPCSYMIDRGSPDYRQIMNDAFNQMSYLAKERGKEEKAKGAWKVMGTRVPKK